MMTRRTWLAMTVLAFSTLSAAAAGKTMTFEIFTDAKDEFRWRLKDADDKLVADSGQGYGKKADCTKMVDNFKADIGKYTFEVYEDDKKEQRFRLKAKNGNVVGRSTKSYKEKADADKVIDAIKTGAKDAEIKVVEKEKEKK